MYKVDIEQFWQDDSLAHKDNCFNPNAPQVALGIRMSDECVFAELGEEGDQWGTEPRERRIELNKRYNDKAEQIVGKRLLREDYPTEDESFPSIRGIGEVFGGKYEQLKDAGMWLSSPINTPKDLERKLDEIDQMDRSKLRSIILPPNWDSEKKRIKEQYGHTPKPNRWVRGPVTLAMSLYGEADLIYLYYDAKELFERYSQTITRVILDTFDLLDEEAGYTQETSPRGFNFADDNCSLLSPEMYEVFGYPALKAAFERYAPNEDDVRYQHSDSDMGHLLPILARLNLTGANFGPTVTVEEIRLHMPKTRIDGQLAPFTFMRNDPEAIIAEIKRDCEMIKASGSKGLNIATAGSINNGSSLESMRVVMHAIQAYGRY